VRSRPRCRASHGGRGTDGAAPSPPGAGGLAAVGTSNDAPRASGASGRPSRDGRTKRAGVSSTATRLAAARSARSCRLRSGLFTWRLRTQSWWRSTKSRARGVVERLETQEQEVLAMPSEDPDNAPHISRGVAVATRKVRHGIAYSWAWSVESASRTRFLPRGGCSPAANVARADSHLRIELVATGQLNQRPERKLPPTRQQQHVPIVRMGGSVA
jgi:hypothetical protein